MVGRLWDQLPLKIPENFGLSRNGVQHGRTEPPNTKVEVIRLLNALETALALHDLLKEDKELSIRQQGGGRDIKPMFALIRANFLSAERLVPQLLMQTQRQRAMKMVRRRPRRSIGPDSGTGRKRWFRRLVPECEPCGLMVYGQIP